MYRPASAETGNTKSESNPSVNAHAAATYGPAEAGTVHTVLLAHGDPDGLRGITQERSVALLTVAGLPLAEHTLDSLRGAGISSALVVLGPHAEQFERVFGTGERWGVALDYLRVPAGESDGAILARVGAELGGDLLVIRCDVLRSPMVDRFLAAARSRAGASSWAAIEGVPAGMAFIRREDVTWLDLPTAGGQAVWEQLGQPIQFRDATLQPGNRRVSSQLSAVRQFMVARGKSAQRPEPPPRRAFAGCGSRRALSVKAPSIRNLGSHLHPPMRTPQK